MTGQILVVNSGSSSLKLSEYNLQLEKVYEGKELALDQFTSVAGIGHRVVHGGDKYIASTVIDKKFIEDLESINELAPLHNKACLEAIKECVAYFGTDVTQVAVFDTAFHCTLPEIASQYAIPLELTAKYHIKRYGFHGIAHAYLWESICTAYRKSKGKVITFIWAMAVP